LNVLGALLVIGQLCVSRDMKLHSTLLGWIGFLTKPCVSPQVFHGSMRLSGGGRVAITARGVEPSRKCSKPGSLKPGDALTRAALSTAGRAKSKFLSVIS
jgi:hypothetical protein